MENHLKDNKRKFNWKFQEVVNLILLFLLIFFLIDIVPSEVWRNDSVQLAVTLSLIGLWRYGWWMIHFIRAQIFARSVFPSKRKKANQLWDSGWRPDNLVFMMTTYREDKQITQKVLASIIREANKVDVPTKLFIGCGDKYDEDIIESYMRKHASQTNISTIIVRQNKPGKRFAIGLALRAMSRHGVGGNDPVVFMDGDSVLAENCLPRCLPFFQMDEKLNALTTDEKVVIEKGPAWIKAWLNMRFSQRHMAMQSHALSNKVLTLTGRMSIFRGVHVVKDDFIRTIEADHLSHWLWDEFRFLSGDDKSTWYWLLKHGSRMYYVPDALVITIERIEGNGKERMIQNLMRWSGNMLRNGSRAIALGPNKVGLFIWWCIVDQRIAMWTTLVGPLSAIMLSFFVSPMIIIVYLIWVLLTRTFLSLMLFPYAGRIQISFPFYLFINQLLNSVIKVYMIFRLPKQRWMNRGNQKAKNQGNRLSEILRNSMASYLTLFWVSILSVSLMYYLKIIKLS